MKADIWEFFKEWEVKFGWIDKGCYGCVDYEKKRISLNPALMLAIVFFHEYYHAKTGDSNENRALGAERKILKKLLAAEVRQLGEHLILLWAKQGDGE